VKTRIFFAALVCLGLFTVSLQTVFAQSVPEKINYQGRLFDGSGLPVDSMSVPMTFSLWDASTSGAELWSEYQAVEVQNGLYHVLLGDSLSIPVSVFSGGTVYMELVVGGETLTPRQRLASVPYAMKAASVGDGAVTSTEIEDGTVLPEDLSFNYASSLTQGGPADGLSCTDCLNETQVEDIYVLNTTDSMSGNLTVGGDLEVIGNNIGIGRSPGASYSIINESSTAPTVGAAFYGASYGVQAVNTTYSYNTYTNLGGADHGLYAAMGDVTATGDKSGGIFSVTSQDNTFGLDTDVRSYAIGSEARAFNGWAQSMNGNAYGGYFETSSSGGGIKYGIFAKSIHYTAWLEDGQVHIGSGGTVNQTDGDGDLYVMDELEVDGVATFSGGFDAPGAIDPSDVSFNYAGSSTQGGPADGLSCTDCVKEDQVADIYVLNTTDSMSGSLTVGGDLEVTGNNIGIGTAPNSSYGITNDSASAPSYAAVLYGGLTGLYAYYAPNAGSHYAYLASSTTGVFGRSGDSSETGDMFGGQFQTYSQGNSYAVYGLAYGYSIGSANGTYGYARNFGSGRSIGGYFGTSLDGTGEHFGVISRAVGNSASETAYGIQATGLNTASGDAYGGYFEGSSDGTGTHYGVYATADDYPVRAELSSDPEDHFAELAALDRAVLARAGNSDEMSARYGADLRAYSQSNAYGVYGRAYGYGNPSSYGIRGYAYNSSDGVAYAGYFTNSSSGTGSHYGIRVASSGTASTPTNYGVYAYATGADPASNIGLYSYVANAADFALYAPNGQKSWVNPDPEDPTQQVVYVTLEGGFAGTYFAGRAELINGKATVILPDHFRKVTNGEENVMVTVTPRGRCNGLMVPESSNDQFVVEELLDGKSDVEFDFIVMGTRLGYEEYEPIRENTDYVPFEGNLADLDESEMTTQEFYDKQSDGLKKIFKRNGTLDEKGKINKALFADKGWKDVKVKKQKEEL
jgi:hypothetical protein